MLLLYNMKQNNNKLNQGDLKMTQQKLNYS